jgi:metal-dependent amidase/aminoacylase/carboxypeptidase family protein
MRTSAYIRLKVEYFGQEAHAAASPWLGINALDALITAYNALSVLRQQTMPGDVIQGHITDGGLAPNIIHAYAAGAFVVRANTRTRLKELQKKVARCFESGATATGAKLKLTEEGSYDDHVPNHTLGRSYRKYFNHLGGDIPEQCIDEIQGRTMASTDQGNISHSMPSLSAGFWIRPGIKGTGPHSPEFTKASGTREAFDLALRVGKGLARTAVDVLVDKSFLKEVKDEFDREVKGRQ